MHKKNKNYEKSNRYSNIQISTYLTVVPAFFCIATSALLFHKGSPPLQNQPATPFNLLLLTGCAISLFALYLVYRNTLTQQSRLLRYRLLSRKLVQVKRIKRREENRAVAILNHIVNQHENSVDLADIWQRPLYGFCGDLAIVCESNCGKVYALLADLTGHGIAAAMGAAPVASIFKATARLGLPVEEIVEELNNQLSTLLPSGFFCCAGVVMCDRDKGIVTVCNAGLPEILIATDQGVVSDKIESTQLPLGIQPVSAENVCLISKQYSSPHQVYAFTDGLLESQNDKQQPFDLNRLTEVVSRLPYGTGRLEGIKYAYDSFIKGSQPNDDISIVEVAIC